MGYVSPLTPIPERFWQKVKVIRRPNICWLWVGARSHSGYGAFYDPKIGQISAHRYSWKLHSGSLPPKHLQVCHKCDVKHCVRPDHLFLGTAKDNAADCISKGRWVSPVGVQNGHAKLNDKKVREIRSRFESSYALASVYGVSRETIRDVRLRKVWAHVTD